MCAYGSHLALPPLSTTLHHVRATTAGPARLPGGLPRLTDVAALLAGSTLRTSTTWRLWALRCRLMKVGFIGLGQMGNRMVRNLANAGHEVTVFDLRPEAARALAGTPNIRSASSVAETVTGNDVVFASLPAPADGESVALGPAGIADSAEPGTIFVDLSTNAPSVARSIAAAPAEKGIAMR